MKFVLRSAIAALLLCSFVHAQKAKHPNFVLSKEFKPAARKAFTAIERLHSGFFDSDFDKRNEALDDLVQAANDVAETNDDHFIMIELLEIETMFLRARVVYVREKYIVSPTFADDELHSIMNRMYSECYRAMDDAVSNPTQSVKWPAGCRDSSAVAVR